MVSNNLWRTVVSLVMAVLICFVSSVSKADDSSTEAMYAMYYGVSTNLFPIYTPNPEVYPPSNEFPTTPVPPVPTDAELYQGALIELFAINADINSVNGDIALYEYLLELDPGNQMVQDYLNVLTGQLTNLQMRRQMKIDYMKTLYP